MMFVFAYIGTLTSPPGSNDWPVTLMYVTEAALVLMAFVCLSITGIMRRKAPIWRDVVAVVGGISAGVGLIMPFELAPFFFHAPGEIMLGTIVLILAYPVLVIPFILGLRKLMNGEAISIKRNGTR